MRIKAHAHRSVPYCGQYAYSSLALHHSMIRSVQIDEKMLSNASIDTLECNKDLEGRMGKNKVKQMPSFQVAVLAGNRSLLQMQEKQQSPLADSSISTHLLSTPLLKSNTILTATAAIAIATTTAAAAVVEQPPQLLHVNTTDPSNN